MMIVKICEKCNLEFGESLDDAAFGDYKDVGLCESCRTNEQDDE